MGIVELPLKIVFHLVTKHSAILLIFFSSLFSWQQKQSQMKNVKIKKKKLVKEK
jgi:hypothetical protein